MHVLFITLLALNSVSAAANLFLFGWFGSPVSLVVGLLNVAAAVSMAILLSRAVKP